MVDGLDEESDELDGVLEDPLKDCTSLMDPFQVETILMVNLIQTLIKSSLINQNLEVNQLI